MLLWTFLQSYIATCAVTVDAILTHDDDDNDGALLFRGHTVIFFPRIIRHCDNVILTLINTVFMVLYCAGDVMLFIFRLNE